MTTATTPDTTTAATGTATNERAKPSLPKLKPEFLETAARLRSEMKVDTTTNTIPEQRAAIDKELEAHGYTRAGLTKQANDLHNITAAYGYASGQTSLSHWENQKTEERGPVAAPMSYMDGQSTTFTHVPTSIEPIPGKSETVVVHGQVNVQNHTTIGRNVGSMSAMRQHLRAAAAASLK